MFLESHLGVCLRLAFAFTLVYLGGNRMTG